MVFLDLGKGLSVSSCGRTSLPNHVQAAPKMGVRQC